MQRPTRGKNKITLLCFVLYAGTKKIKENLANALTSKLVGEHDGNKKNSARSEYMNKDEILEKSRKENDNKDLAEMNVLVQAEILGW